MVCFGILIILGIGAFVMACLTHGQPRANNSIWHWNYLVPGLEESPDAFYEQVHRLLQEGVQVERIPLKGLGFGPTHLFEQRTIFGDRPLYMEARYKHTTYYLYASPTPAGLYVSQWLFSKYVYHPADPFIIRFAVAWHKYQQTLFQHDATLMFGHSMHKTVLAVLDRYIEEQGLTPLDAFERRPVLAPMYGPAMPAATAGPASQPGMRRLPI